MEGARWWRGGELGVLDGGGRSRERLGGGRHARAARPRRACAPAGRGAAREGAGEG